MCSNINILKYGYYGGMNMNKIIGLLAHVDAGKTTFAEALLYHTNSIRQRGRIDYKNAFLDSHDIEKQRGITIFADQAVMSYKDANYYLIDTPGHVDFSSEMERALQVMDYAVIIVSAIEGVEAHTETVWNLLRKYKIPSFFFINKIDRIGADANAVIKNIKLNLTDNICDITEELVNDSISNGLIEFIAERDEVLLEKYMEGSIDTDLWISSMKVMIKECRIFPCLSGSALQDIGIENFLEKLNKLTFADYDLDKPFAGRVYKIRHDISGARVTFIKALSGSLKVRDEISYGDDVHEKITQIRIYNSSKFKAVEEARAGELFAVTGLSAAEAGDSIGALSEKTIFELVPALKSKVVFDKALNPKEVLRCFKILDSEDPALKVTWEEALQEIHISVMGVVQLEVLEQIVKERFNLDASFGTPEIIYKETITSQAIGYGHFEPLKHYAEVHLKVEPNTRGKGVTYESSCHTDNLSVGVQNVIGRYILEREHHGILTGSALTDVKIKLLTGADHIKHTEGGDFREAAYRALRQGLEKVNNILLEPYYDFKIKVDLEHMGRVLSDIQGAYGSFEPPKIMENKAIITGKVPVVNFMNYSTELASFTQGRGIISVVFGGYHRCHNEEEVIKRKGYNKNADIEYTSSSIFCSKGQAYIVSWDEAESKMHLLK
ncbi:putative translation elongation factor G [Clostridiales bacterium oral taxon 876 str. F0540]|nr:putative translation elongation factor G [Clostridiales bacterium oral taxon 876 str. F0540]